MSIDNFRATKVDASFNWMSIEFGNGGEDGESIAAPKKTAYGKYLLYMIQRDAVNGSGKINWRYLGIIPIGTVKYLMTLHSAMAKGAPNSWRPNTGVEFRKLMSYARKTEEKVIKKDEDTFPYIEKHFERYAEIRSVEKIVK